VNLGIQSANRQYLGMAAAAEEIADLDLRGFERNARHITDFDPISSFPDGLFPEFEPEPHSVEDVNASSQCNQHQYRFQEEPRVKLMSQKNRSPEVEVHEPTGAQNHGLSLDNEWVYDEAAKSRLHINSDTHSTFGFEDGDEDENYECGRDLTRVGNDEQFDFRFGLYHGWHNSDDVPDLAGLYISGIILSVLSLGR
jgi:hypothetical protein